MNTNQAAKKKIVNIIPGEWISSGNKLILGIEHAKQNLAAEHGFALPERLFRVAVNEAEALAWETEYPQLLFPTLAEEKIETLSAWYTRGGGLHSHYALAV